MKTRSGRKFGVPIFSLREASKSSTQKQKQKKSPRKKKQPPIKFDGLNEDCIEEIFRHLPTVELCKFTVLNKRLKEIAERLFQRLYSSKILTFKPYESCATQSGVRTTKLFMRSFGKFIQQLQIVGTEKKTEKRMEANMLAAMRGFRGTNLRAISLVRLDMDERLVSHLEKMLKNVPQLTLQCCHAVDRQANINELLLKKCHNLQTFNVIQCNWDHSTWLKRRHSTLRTVQVLRAIFNFEDVEKFYEMNPHIKEVWFNVRVPKLTHRHDMDRLHRLLFISGFEEGEYCSYFLQTYTQITVKSVVLMGAMITEDKCKSMAQMTDIQELRLISPISVCENMVKLLSVGLNDLKSLFLKGDGFSFQIICDILNYFPTLEHLYLCQTAFDSITEHQFLELVAARQRSATIETENFPLNIVVGRKTPVYARTMWRRLNAHQTITVETMKSLEFDTKFCELK